MPIYARRTLVIVSLLIACASCEWIRVTNISFGEDTSTGMFVSSNTKYYNLKTQGWLCGTDTPRYQDLLATYNEFEETVPEYDEDDDSLESLFMKHMILYSPRNSFMHDMSKMQCIDLGGDETRVDDGEQRQSMNHTKLTFQFSDEVDGDSVELNFISYESIYLIEKIDTQIQWTSVMTVAAKDGEKPDLTYMLTLDKSGMEAKLELAKDPQTQVDQNTTQEMLVI